jgi:sulfite exporter TauE/SafE
MTLAGCPVISLVLPVVERLRHSSLKDIGLLVGFPLPAGMVYFAFLVSVHQGNGMESIFDEGAPI